MFLPEEKANRDEGYKGVQKYAPAIRQSIDCTYKAMLLERTKHKSTNHGFKLLGTLQQLWWYEKHKNATILKAPATITQLEIKNDRPHFQIDRCEDLNFLYCFAYVV